MIFSVTWWCDKILGFKKQWALRARERFFNEIVHLMSAPPDQVAITFGQTTYCERVDLPNVISQPEYGTLYIPMKAEFEGVTCDHAWSIYQTGERLRIAVILSGGLERAVLVDWNQEMAMLWPGVAMQQLDRKDLTLYEWTFNDCRVYQDFVAQESFALNMRHCQARVLRILHDYAIMEKDNART